MRFSDLAYVEKALSEPLDLEREAWRAARRRYVPIYDRGRWTSTQVWRDPYRMSGYTGTFVETLYSSAGAGASLATFTAEAMMYGATQPECLIPAGFFDPTLANNKTIRFTMRGVYSTTATPTFTPGLRIGSAGGGVTGQILGTSAAITSQSTVTNLVWEIEGDIISNTPSFGSSHNQTSLVCLGQVGGVSTGVSSFANGSAIGTLTPTTALTLTQSDIANYLVPSVTCGTSSASNKWQMLQLIVQGMN